MNKIINKKTGIYFFLLILVAYNSFAQKTIITGIVYADETREPLAFANIYFGHTVKNISTNFDGNFYYSSDSFVTDSIFISYSGYETKGYKVKHGDSNYFDVALVRAEQVIDMGTIKVVSKINPALIWLKKAKDNRIKNNPDNIEFYNCESFTKTTIAVNNINEKLKRGKLGKQIGGLFDTISYISADKNMSILPVFISEVISDFYYNKTPKLTKEIIKASRLKGVGVQDGTFISQVLGNTFVSYNFYANDLTVIDKGIPSPIGESADIFYKYKLVNVDLSGKRNIAQIKVIPKNEKDLAFSGYIWIEDSTGALIKLSLELNNNSNLNYIEKLRITQEYAPSGSGAFICVASRVLVDAAEVNTKAAGAVASNTITYKNINTKNKKPVSFFQNRIEMKPDALNKPDSFWNTNRHTPLTDAERRIYNKIDTLVNLPAVKTYVDLVNFLVDGYFDLGKFDKVQFGPYFNALSWNRMEGLRFRMGFRTSYKLSRNWLVEGFGAYGLKDERFKYSLRVDRILERKKWIKVSGLYRRDVELIGFLDQDENSGGLFNAFNLLGSRNLALITEGKIGFGTDIIHGLRANIWFSNRRYDFQRVDTFNFAWRPYLPDTSILRQNFTNSAVTFSLRYGPKDYYLQNDNRRVTFTNIGSVYYGFITRGFKNVLSGEFDFWKFTLGYTRYKVWGPIGRTSLTAEGNRVIGILPYPLLNNFIGNQSFIFNTAAYNQMRIFEFVTDKSASINIEHHFNGFFFNRIPLLNKLKWREIIQGKSIVGSLDKRNFDLIPKQIDNVNITQFKTFDKIPYLEIGFGIENIFKIIRIDAIWRLTYLYENGPRPFGVKASVGVAF